MSSAVFFMYLKSRMLWAKLLDVVGRRTLYGGSVRKRRTVSSINGALVSKLLVRTRALPPQLCRHIFRENGTLQTSSRRFSDKARGAERTLETKSYPKDYGIVAASSRVFLERPFITTYKNLLCLISGSLKASIQPPRLTNVVPASLRRGLPKSSPASRTP